MKRKKSTRRSRITRNFNNQFVRIASNEKCSNCSHIKQRHSICLNCGFYKGKCFDHLIK